MTGTLTTRQQQALDALEQAITANGYAPTVREFATVLGVTTNAATALLVALEAKGAIKRWPGKARAISIVGAEELGREARDRLEQEAREDAAVDAAREEA